MDWLVTSIGSIAKEGVVSSHAPFNSWVCSAHRNFIWDVEKAWK